jgi:hypothetical protein
MQKWKESICKAMDSLINLRISTLNPYNLYIKDVMGNEVYIYFKQYTKLL